MSKSWTAHFALLAAIAAGASACGTQTGEEDKNSQALADPSATRGQIQMTFERFYGSQSERAAAEYLIAWGLNGETDRCMAAKGFDSWDWSGAVETPLEFDPLYTTVIAAEPSSDHYTAQLRADAARADRETQLNNPPEKGAEYTQAIVECVNSSGSMSDSEVNAIRGPEARSELFTSWHRAVASAADEVLSISTYEACMDRAELSVMRGRPFTIVGIEEAFEASRPNPATLPARVATDESYGEFAAAEDEYEEADWGCRSGKYDEIIGNVGVAANEFAHTHETQIAELDAHWDEVTQRATDLGWQK